jgi:RHS repeat-associated protein
LNIDEPLTRITGSTIRHYVKDALGSVIALTDDTGVVRTTYTYDPFGNVTVSGETSDNPFQYTGRENDGIGLYYYRARYYSPELQRFISEDPIRLAGGDVNYYAYVGNNPVNWIDPLGLLSQRTKCLIACNAAFALPCTTVGFGVNVVATPVAGIGAGLACRVYLGALCYQICPPPDPPDPPKPPKPPTPPDPPDKPGC